MNNESFDPISLRDIVLDLINSNQRDLSWKLIDHYYQKSNLLEHFDILGYLSLKAEKRDTYLSCAEAVHCLSQTSEQLFNARINLAKAYNKMNRPEKALFYINQNLSIDPNNFDLLCEELSSIILTGDKILSEKKLTYLVTRYPKLSHKLQSVMSKKYLEEGQTAKGILSFVEAAKPKNHLFEIILKMEKWTGEISPGEKLYVSVEGGIGDLIINIRFFDKVRSLGMFPILVSQDDNFYNDMNEVFRRHGYEVLTDTVLIDRRKKWVPIMSLPGYLNVTEKDLWNGVYLRPLRKEKNKLAGQKFKIGIKCAGNPFFSQDEYRKIPIETMLEYLPKDADLYYIDKEKIQSEDPRIINLSEKISSWEDTLDFIDQMDCIVSSCTSLVHASGAMGKVTFVAVPILEYYIWNNAKDNGVSPWYGDNFYVSRQTKLRDWKDTLIDIQSRVQKLAERKHI